jgi:hypothetical protein
MRLVAQADQDETEAVLLDEMVKTLAAYFEIKDRLARDKHNGLNISFEMKGSQRIPVYAAEVELREFEEGPLKQQRQRIRKADMDVNVLYRKALQQLQLRA